MLNSSGAINEYCWIIIVTELYTNRTRLWFLVIVNAVPVSVGSTPVLPFGHMFGGKLGCGASKLRDSRVVSIVVDMH